MERWYLLFSYTRSEICFFRLFTSSFFSFSRASRAANIFTIVASATFNLLDRSLRILYGNFFLFSALSELTAILNGGDRVTSGKWHDDRYHTLQGLVGVLIGVKHFHFWRFFWNNLAEFFLSAIFQCSGRSEQNKGCRWGLLWRHSIRDWESSALLAGGCRSIDSSTILVVLHTSDMGRDCRFSEKWD